MLSLRRHKLLLIAILRLQTALYVRMLNDLIVGPVVELLLRLLARVQAHLGVELGLIGAARRCDHSNVSSAGLRRWRRLLLLLTRLKLSLRIELILKLLLLLIIRVDKLLLLLRRLLSARV